MVDKIDIKTVQQENQNLKDKLKKATKEKKHLEKALAVFIPEIICPVIG